MLREVSKDDIREIFMRNGFTIKEGQEDLKPYVYAAAYDLLIFASTPIKFGSLEPVIPPVSL